MLLFSAEMDAPTYPLGRRAWQSVSTASSWEELWEAGTYYERVAEVLEDAENFAILVGWQVDSRLPFHRPARPGQPKFLETLQEKMIRLCENKPDFRVYFLMWDHAYFYSLERETLQSRIWDAIHPRIHFVFDNRHPWGASHHEKLVVVDGKIGFCGGIDLCDERWDSPQHLFRDPRRSLDWRKEHHGPYHDLTVQVTGPVCARLQEHVARRWRQISSVPFPDPPEAVTEHIHGGHRVYLSRTLTRIDAGERGVPIVREIEHLLLQLIDLAEKRIIIENQYYWSAEINERLIRKIRQMAGTDFEVILVLADIYRVEKLTRYMAVHGLRLLKDLEDAARSSGVRFTAATPLAHPSPGDHARKPRPVFLHSKAMLIDDRFFTVGSANFASRSLRLDTELNLTFEATTAAERMHLQKVGERILKHWNWEADPENHIQLRKFEPGRELKSLLQEQPWITSIPWKMAFDPKLPWLYFIKRQYRIMERTRSGARLLLLFSGWIASVTTTVLVADLLGLAITERWLTIFYAALLSSTWLLPTPFVFASLLASLQLDAESAGALATSALWGAGTLGYTVCRMFPTSAGRFYRRTAPRKLPHRIGLRRFPYIISVVADPRVSVRSKLAFQGLFAIPFPWFVLGTLLVLPGAIYLGCEAMQLLPEVLKQLVDENAPAFATALVIYTGIRIGLNRPAGGER